jgi:hypothetical protein
MTDFRLFPRVFEDVITAVRAEYDPTNNLKPVYEFGTYLELTKRTAIKDDNIAAGKVEVKYPLVWLVWEANENEKRWDSRISYKISPRIFICAKTEIDYTSTQRYANTFESIIYPIWDLIQDEMQESGSIGYSSSKIPKDYEHFYWGESIGVDKKKGVITDTLDALEIKFEGLEIFPRSC